MGRRLGLVYGNLDARGRVLDVDRSVCSCLGVGKTGVLVRAKVTLWRTTGRMGQVPGEDGSHGDEEGVVVLLGQAVYRGSLVWWARSWAVWQESS